VSVVVVAVVAAAAVVCAVSVAAVACALVPDADVACAVVVAISTGGVPLGRASSASFDSCAATCAGCEEEEEEDEAEADAVAAAVVAVAAVAVAVAAPAVAVGDAAGSGPDGTPVTRKCAKGDSFWAALTDRHLSKPASATKIQSTINR